MSSGAAILYYLSTCNDAATVLRRADRVFSRVHADAGADELDFVPSSGRSGPAVSRHPRAGHDRLDRRRADGRLAVHRRADNGDCTSSGRSACRSRFKLGEQLGPEAKIEPTTIPMLIAAGAQLLLGIFCLALPHTPPSKREGGQTVQRRPGPRCTGADEAMVVPRVRRRFVPDLHSAAVLLHVYESVS